MNAHAGLRAYDSIAHLPGSRMTAADHRATANVAAACLEESGDTSVQVIVQEKLDGSCMAVWRDGGQLIATARSGRLARESELVQHRLFGLWVDSRRDRFLTVLRDGERLVGEWLALAHGTRYALPHDPFVVFDLFAGDRPLSVDRLVERIGTAFILPRIVCRGSPQPIASVLARLDPSGHGALDPVEGAVWRVERSGCPAAIAKWVRPEKDDGKYLPGAGSSPAWNWRPPDDWMWAAAGGYSGQG